MSTIIQARWKFNKDQYSKITPSRQDGVSMEDENKMRSSGIQFIKDISNLFQLKHSTIATAFTYFHRFFMRASFKEYTQNDIGAAAVFLAMKTDIFHEIDVSIDDVAKACTRIEYNNDVVDEKWIEKWIEVILCKEISLAERLYFDFTVEDLPHFHVIKFLKNSKNLLDIKKNDMIKTASLIISQTYHHPICLYYSSREIASSVIYISSKYNGLENSSLGSTWWESIGSDLFVIYNCIQDILNTYPTPPKLKKLNVEDDNPLTNTTIIFSDDFYETTSGFNKKEEEEKEKLTEVFNSKGLINSLPNYELSRPVIRSDD